MKKINNYIIEKLVFKKGMKDTSKDQLSGKDYMFNTYSIIQDYFLDKYAIEFKKNQIKTNLVNYDDKFRVDIKIEQRIYKRINDIRKILTDLLKENNITNYSCSRPFAFGQGPWEFSITFYKL